MLYYVILFEQPPTEDYDKYVCVPHSWVLDHHDNKIVFRYPTEKASITKKRITKGESVRKEWPIYLETVNYKSQSHDDAKGYAKMMERYYRKTCNAKYSPKNSLNSKFNGEGSEKPKPNRTNQRSIGEGSNITHEVNDSTTTDYTLNAKEVHTLCENIQSLVKEMKRQNDCIAKLNVEFEEIRNVSLSNAASLNEMQSMISVNQADCVQADTDTNTDIDTDRDGDYNPRENNKTAKSITKARRSVTVQKTPAGWKDVETLKGKYIWSDWLPPDYDENDSKWTLRYRAMDPGLDELQPGTGVYVHSERFANCKTMAKDAFELGKLLLFEVFTISALHVCSFTGRKPVGDYLDTTPVRPGLDEHARNVLLNFLEDYSDEMGWHEHSSSFSYDLKRTLMSKLQTIHKKYKNTKLGL